MTEPCTKLDYASSDNLMVIDAYLQRAQTAKAADAEFNGWLERLDAVGQLNRVQLTKVHGELIAAGYLKFEIGSSNVGLKYQVSPRGRQLLDRMRLAAEDDAAVSIDDEAGVDTAIDTVEERLDDAA